MIPDFVYEKKNVIPAINEGAQLGCFFITNIKVYP